MKMSIIYKATNWRAYCRSTNVIHRRSFNTSHFIRESCLQFTHKELYLQSVRQYRTSTTGYLPERQSAKQGYKLNNEESLPRKVVDMRSRMSELYGLQDDGCVVKTVSDNTVFTETVDEIVSANDLNDQNEDNIRHSVENTDESADGEFIQSLLTPNRQNKDVYVSMPFGLARFDSMNKRGQTKARIVDDRKQMKTQHTAANVTSECVDDVNQHLKTIDRQQETNVDNVSKTELTVHCDQSVETDHHHDGNLFEEHYFDALTDLELYHQYMKQNEPKNPVNATANYESNLFDEQYFGNQIDHENIKTVIHRHHETDKESQQAAAEKDNIFEQQYFLSSFDKGSDEVSSQFDTNLLSTSMESRALQDIAENNYNIGKMSKIDSINEKVTKRSMLLSRPKTVSKEDTQSAHYNIQSFPGSRTGRFNDCNDDETAVVEPVTRREMKARTKPVADIDNPQTAYDYAMKLRLEKRQIYKNSDSATSSASDSVLPRESKWQGAVDSKGFRILKDQVLDLDQHTQEEVVSILKDSIIYEDDKLLAIDKPYGLASHGGPKIHHSVGKLLEPLAKRVDKSGRLNTLHLVHRLDKETTGVMVLAKTLQTAEFLLAMFKNRQVIKHYWVITKGVPNPEEGIIDIPMMEGIIGNKHRMQLKPDYRSVGNTREIRKISANDTFEAVTNYRVLSSNEDAALVQCTPETGVKHQIRCHLAFGLNTPILGDHKYSHFSKIAPQRLYPEILGLLGIRQSKVRHLPMHLHAKAIVLPEWLEGRNLFISARLPKHFVQNMKWLKLKPPN